ncbi:MAG: lipopolysaccharide assembly protein LapA domain-containing protein [Candidatus Microthrix parvicella]
MNESETTGANTGERPESLPDPTSEPMAKTSPAPETERVFIGTGVFWGLVVGLLLAAVLIFLAAQNTDKVTINFLAWEYSTPLIAVILVVLLAGVVLDELAGLVYRARRRHTLTDRRELKRLQKKRNS